MIDLQEKARVIVFEYVRNQLQGTGEEGTLESMDQVRVSWWSKTLGNWKALVITDLPDDMYYEVTHDGQRETTFLDAYVKIENVEIPDQRPVWPDGEGGITTIKPEEGNDTAANDPETNIGLGHRTEKIRDITLRADGYPYSPGGAPKVIEPAEEIITVAVRYGDGHVGDDRPVIGEADVNMQTGRTDIRIYPEALADADGHAKLASLIDSGDFMPMSFGFRGLVIGPTTIGTPDIFRLDDKVKLRMEAAANARSDGGSVRDLEALAGNPEDAGRDGSVEIPPSP